MSKTTHKDIDDSFTNKADREVVHNLLSRIEELENAN